MSQQKLARGLGITFPQVQKYKNGSNRVTVARLKEIAEILGTSLPDMVDGIGDGQANGTIARAESLENDKRALLDLMDGIEDPARRQTLIEVAKSMSVRTARRCRP